MDRRRAQYTRLARARIVDGLVTSTCTSDVTRMDWHSPPTGAHLHSNNAAQQQPWSHRPPRMNRQGSTAQPIERYEGAVQQQLLIPAEQPTSHHTRPRVSGTQSKELVTCSAHTITASRIATNVALLNRRQSLHRPSAREIQRRRSGPLTPSSRSVNNQRHAGHL